MVDFRNALLLTLFTFLLFIISSNGNNVFNYGHNNHKHKYRPYSDRLVDTKCTVLMGDLNKIYKNNVTLAQSITYVFHLEKWYIQNSHKTNLRVEVAANSQDATLRSPLLFVVQQQRQISSIEVPYVFEDSKDKSLFYTGGRTLCIDDFDPTEGDEDGRNITIRVTTQSIAPVRFYVELSLHEDFQLQLGKNNSFEVSPTGPKYYGFTFSKPNLSLVKVLVKSKTQNCMTVSIQSIQCPVHDTEDNVQYKGLWQTMSTSAAMTVQKKGWYQKGFFLVFVTHIDEDACSWKDFYDDGNSNKTVVSPSSQWDGWNDLPMMAGNRIQNDPRSKTITVVISDESQTTGGIIWLCLLLPIVVTLLVCLAVFFLFRNRHQWMATILKQLFSHEEVSHPFLRTGSTYTNGRESSPTPSDADTMSAGSPTPPAQAINPVITSNSAASQKQEPTGRIKWKADLCIANFHCKEYYEIKKFSKRFYWTILIVAVFYCIPVYQLVVHYLRVLYRTGEYDICYYNYLCAQRLGVLIDFNHFWSNASYVIFGILYIVIVRQRSRNLCLPKNGKEENPTGAHDSCKDDEDSGEGSSCFCCCCGGGDGDSDDGSRSGSHSHGKVGRALSSVRCCTLFSTTCFRWDHGIPPHFGVFYALGVALTIEGFLSAAYHLCPNQSTFQFDTAFMYVIAVLLLLKIYQFRHPVYFGANYTFAILAGFIFISVIGLLFERGSDKDMLVFKCIFYPIQYILMIMMFIYYYAVGYVKNENGELVTDASLFVHLGQLKSQRINGDRLILPLISLTICVAVLVYSEVGGMGFASYLLYILVGNVLGTTFYYVGIMKPLHGEFKNWTWVQPAIYFLAAGVIGGFSLMYFMRAPAQWELSASASREVNEECLSGWFPFHPFYDSHDAWHFLSAAALFLAFMGLLIVDDDLVTTPQSKIPVF